VISSDQDANQQASFFKESNMAQIRTFKISATRGDEKAEFTFAGAENQDWHRSDLVTQGWTNILITETTKKS
jgi:hypothetical protein